MSQKPLTQKAAAGKAVELYPASDSETALARGENPDCSRRAAPAVWVNVIGRAKPIFSYKHPALVFDAARLPGGMAGFQVGDQREGRPRQGGVCRSIRSRSDGREVTAAVKDYLLYDNCPKPEYMREHYYRCIQAFYSFSI
jgi:hypothetical protein